MRRKNKIEISKKCADMDFFKLAFWKRVLNNFFIPLRWAKAITWENFVSAKWDPGSAKEGSRLAGMKFFTCNCKYNL